MKLRKNVSNTFFINNKVDYFYKPGFKIISVSSINNLKDIIVYYLYKNEIGDDVTENIESDDTDDPTSNLYVEDDYVEDGYFV